MQKRNFLRTGMLIFSVGALVFGYSNCSPQSLPATDDSSTSASSTGGTSTKLSVIPNSQTVSTGSQINFLASGGTAPYVFTSTAGCGTMTSGGLFVAASSMASGSTTTTCQVTLTDSVGATATGSIALVAAAATPLVVTYSPTTVVAGTAATFTVSGGTPGYTLTVVSSGGTVAGEVLTTSTTAGPVTVQITDSGNQTTTVTFTTLTCAANTTATCSANNGTGTYTCNATGTAYGTCMLTTCTSPAVLYNNSCVLGSWVYSQSQPRNGLSSCQGTNLPNADPTYHCNTIGAEGCGMYGSSRNPAYGYYICTAM